jgi:hypothetical protein
MIRVALWISLIAVLLTPARETSAHEVRPAFLELSETEANHFIMTWKVPALGDFRLSVTPRLPASCHLSGGLTSIRAGGAFIEHGRVNCDRDLAGQTITIDGLGATMTDVLARIRMADGTVRSARMTPSDPSFTVPAQAGPLMVLSAYIGLGVEHILFGIDHLLFVLCLLLMVHGIRNLLATVTAFTLAHSITLAAATLGFIRVPAAPVEASIALSIVFLASELVRGGARPTVARSYPWLVAFTFGLLHGLGFAGALAEVGLPQGEIPLALFAFNVGVELGQLAFVAAVLSLVRLVQVAQIRLPAWTPRAAGYAIGSMATFWVFARLSAAA